MELFTKLFSDLLVFVYHCFDRIVIHGYLSGLSRPGQVVYFFRQVVGVAEITKEVLSRRTNDYQHWVEAFACNHSLPIAWAEKGVRKQDDLRPHLRRMEKRQQYGVYFILKSMEQGSTFRSTPPKYPTVDPHYRLLAKQRSRFTHYYFYLRDEVLGPMVMRVASFFPFHTTYYLNGHNFIAQELNRQGVVFRQHDNAFLATANPQALQAKRSFPIHRLFERSCELGVWRWTSDHFSQVFGIRVTRRLRGKLHTTLEKIEHGHHVFRAYWKNAFVKQYEKFLTFLRAEVCSNNLRDFGLKKGLEHLAAVRCSFLGVLDRFSTLQASALNVHVDFPFFQHLAQPLQQGATRIPGLKIHDLRVVRLLEVLLHGSTTVGGWTTATIHQVVLTTYALSSERYRLTQLRYDLRKLRAHGLLERHGRRYAYRLTAKGVKVALLFTLFHQRICGPLANSLFHHRPDPTVRPKSKLEAAYHRADASIQQVIELVQAA